VRIVTWNVNSVRLRINAARRLIRQFQPDVLCLQETKVADEHFPTAPFVKLGYPHIALAGQKAYHGVALISRLPLGNVERPTWCGRRDGRHLMATLPGGIEVHNFYVPAGGDLPDPARNDKFAHKLDFVAEVTDWFAAHRTPADRIVLVGDLNIAPLETDVWSHKQLLRVVSHTPVEVAAMARWRASLDWVDAVRKFTPESEKLYSWWSYRSPNWAKADKGRRLDHIWVTPALDPALLGAEVVAKLRGWATPSDHVPVVVDLGAD